MSLAAAPAQLLKEAEALELALCDKLDDAKSAARFHTNSCQQLILYLIENRLEDARFLWRRLATVRDTMPQLQAAWNVGKCLWKRRDIPEALRLLKQSPWEEQTVHLAEHAVQCIRQRELNVIGRVYSVVPLASVAESLMLTDQEALELCRQNDWTFDATSAMIHPTPLVDPGGKIDGLKQLEQLTSIVTHLTS